MNTFSASEIIANYEEALERYARTNSNDPLVWEALKQEVIYWQDAWTQHVIDNWHK